MRQSRSSETSKPSWAWRESISPFIFWVSLLSRSSALLNCQWAFSTWPSFLYILPISVGIGASRGIISCSRNSSSRAWSNRFSFTRVFAFWQRFRPFRGSRASLFSKYLRASAYSLLLVSVMPRKEYSTGFRGLMLMAFAKCSTASLYFSCLKQIEPSPHHALQCRMSRFKAVSKHFLAFEKSSLFRYQSPQRLCAQGFCGASWIARPKNLMAFSCSFRREKQFPIMIQVSGAQRDLSRAEWAKQQSQVGFLSCQRQLLQYSSPSSRQGSSLWASLQYLSAYWYLTTSMKQRPMQESTQPDLYCPSGSFLNSSMAQAHSKVHIFWQGRASRCRNATTSLPTPGFLPFFVLLSAFSLKIVLTCIASPDFASMNLPSFWKAVQRVGFSSSARRQLSLASMYRCCFSQIWPSRLKPKAPPGTFSILLLPPRLPSRSALYASFNLFDLKQARPSLYLLPSLLHSLRRCIALQCLFQAKQHSARTPRLSSESRRPSSRSARKAALAGWCIARLQCTASAIWAQSAVRSSSTCII